MSSVLNLDNLCYNFNINAHCSIRMTSCHTFYTFTQIVMLIKQFIAKYFWGTFSKESKHTSLCWATAVLVNPQHSQLNGTKSVELEIVYAQVHLLNEGRLYKMDQKKTKNINEMQFYYITRWHRCCILTQRVINKVHIGPQLEYIISKQFSVSKTLFHSAHHVLKLIKIQQVQQATSYPSDCCRTPAMERRSSASLSRDGYR